MEKGFRFKKTLAGSYKKDLWPVQSAIDKEILRQDKTKNFLLRELPGEVWVRLDAGCWILDAGHCECGVVTASVAKHNTGYWMPDAVQCGCDL